MARVIEVQDALACSSTFEIQVGDMLEFAATGGHVRSGADVLELLGAFVPAVLDDSGRPLSALGAPSVVKMLARLPGRATIDLHTGDPWRSPRTTTLSVTVAP
jgi:hypothetical protein